MKEIEARRVLYLLPSFKFAMELNPDECAICRRASDVVIDSKNIPPYGLCQRHFDALIKLEEEA